MKSLNNPNRFLRSVQQWVHGNPQPPRYWRNAIVASFTGFRRPRRKVRPHKIFIPKSAAFWRT